MEKIKILMIDDNKQFINSAINFFNKGNMELKYFAYNGFDGVNLIQSEFNNYDIILLDMVMPNKDGFYVLDKLEELDIKKSIIVLTGYNWELIINRVTSYDISYFMIKPVDFIDLEKRIKDVYYLYDKKNILSDCKHKKIVKILHKLGMPSNLKGFDYIKSAIIILISEKKMIIKDLYIILAKEYSTTVHSVERSIRHAIEKSWEKNNIKFVEEIFGQSINFDKSKPTNSEFLKTILNIINEGD